MKPIEYSAPNVNTAAYLMSEAMNDLPRRLKAIREDGERTALRYAREKLLEYSALHPRRECTLAVSMGYATLHVEHWAFGAHGHYQFSAWDTEESFGVDKGTPQFLEVLSKLGQGLGFHHDDWFGPVRMSARGGVLIDERKDW